MIDKLITDMQLAIQAMGQWPGQEIQLFHHNDSDGLCSGAILQKVFKRAGYDVDRFSLEKPYPAVLKKIYDQDGRVLVFADFAGRIAPMISELNQ